MRGESGIEHLVFAESLDEPGGDGAAVLIVARHAEVQRLGAAQREPGVEGAGYGTSRIENELESRREVVVVHDGDTAHHVRVPVEVLGGGVVDDVGAEIERPLEEG